MANLKEVKNRITSVQSTQQITKAMKMVAAAKLRRAQDNIMRMRPYAEKLSSILKNVTAGGGEVNTIYAQEREVNRVLIVVVTSDKGLCGAFNSNVFKATNAHIARDFAGHIAQGKLDILPIGKKAFEYYKKRNFNSIDSYYNIYSDIKFDTAKTAAAFAMDTFEDGTYDRVYIVYNEFKNVATQIIRVEQFLPIVQEEMTAIEIKPVKNKVEYIYEPSKDYIIEELIPTSLKIQFYKAMLESNASEQGARMTAMDKATDNAGELLKELKLTYNRTRQAAITTEILEIVAGAEALGSK